MEKREITRKEHFSHGNIPGTELNKYYYVNDKLSTHHFEENVIGPDGQSGASLLFIFWFLFLQNCWVWDVCECEPMRWTLMRAVECSRDFFFLFSIKKCRFRWVAYPHAIQMNVRRESTILVHIRICGTTTVSSASEFLWNTIHIHNKACLFCLASNTSHTRLLAIVEMDGLLFRQDGPVAPDLRCWKMCVDCWQRQQLY